MRKYVIDETTLVDIGNAIRGKTGKTDLIAPAAMPAEIAGIEGGSGGIPVEIITRELTEYSNSDVEKIGPGAFSLFYWLESVDFPNVKIIGEEVLRNCYFLTEANFPVATTIGAYAFEHCERLPTIVLPSATDIGNYAFRYCYDLETVDLPVATSIGTYAFEHCERLPTIVLPSATDIGGYAFRFCYVLETVDLPVATSIGSYAFRYDEELKSLILRNPDAVCTLSNKNAFNDSSILNKTGYIYVPSALIEQYKVATNWSTYVTQFRALESYTVDGTITGELDETKI